MNGRDRLDTMESLRVVGYQCSLLPLFRKERVTLVYTTLWPMTSNVTYAAYCADDVEGPLDMEPMSYKQVSRHTSSYAEYVEVANAVDRATRSALVTEEALK